MVQYGGVGGGGVYGQTSSYCFDLLTCCCTYLRLMACQFLCQGHNSIVSVGKNDLSHDADFIKFTALKQ